jgi:WXG100 family type VII secretion target
VGDGVASTAVEVYDTATDLTKNVANFTSEALDCGMDLVLWPFVQPLMWVLEQCVGDPEELATKAAAWSQAAPHLTATADDLDRRRASLAESWEGMASAAAQTRLSECAEELRKAAQQLTATAKSLDETAEFLVDVEEEIKVIIREISQWLIAEWIIAQLLAPETWGASEATFLGIAAPATGAVGFARCAAVMSTNANFLAKVAQIYQLMRKGSTMEKWGAWLFKRAVVSKPLTSITGLSKGVEAIDEILGNPLDKIDDFKIDLLMKGAEAIDPLLEPLESVVDPVRPYIDRVHDTVDQLDYESRK